MLFFFFLQWDETNGLEKKSTMVLILLQLQQFTVH
jgi:hypothetical protein